MHATWTVRGAVLLLTCLATALASAAIPPADTGASDALKDSPRHGEWVDVPLEDGTTLKTWIVYPEVAGKAPVVLVIHEIFGLTDWIRAVADQLAADGFIAIAPDLLSGMGPGGGGTESFAGDAVREAIRKLTPDQVAQRLDAVRRYALALPAASAKSASIGFCWGGTASFRYAMRQPQLNAAVVYYGSGPTNQQELASINCPVLGLYGGDDARVTSTVEPSATAMKAAGKSFESHVFDGAGHGFLRQQSARDGANQRAADAAWKRTVEFLHEHLR